MALQTRLFVPLREGKGKTDTFSPSGGGGITGSARRSSRPKEKKKKRGNPLLTFSEKKRDVDLAWDGHKYVRPVGGRENLLASSQRRKRESISPLTKKRIGGQMDRVRTQMGKKEKKTEAILRCQGGGEKKEKKFLARV